MSSGGTSKQGLPGNGSSGCGSVLGEALTASRQVDFGTASTGGRVAATGLSYCWVCVRGLVRVITIM